MNVVVTGANRGIGLQLCAALHARGENVWALVRKASPELAALGLRGGVVEGIDVGSDGVGKALKTGLEGVSIDLLVNNAGVMELGTELDTLGSDDCGAAFDAIRRQFETNSLGPLRVTTALAPNIPDGGKVAIVTSLMGSISDNGSGGKYGYRMSKAAVNMAAKSLSADLRPRNICVSLWHPGMILTDMTRRFGATRTTEEAVKGFLEILDTKMTMEHTGTFWHGNYGEGVKPCAW